MTEPNGASGANGANGDGAGKGQAPVLRNHVAIILDESGSMNAMRQEAMDAFNQQVEAIRAGALGQQATVSLVKFNTTGPDPVYWVQPIDRLRPITREDYVPDGKTAMLSSRR